MNHFKSLNSKVSLSLLHSSSIGAIATRNELSLDSFVDFVANVSISCPGVTIPLRVSTSAHIARMADADGAIRWYTLLLVSALCVFRVPGMYTTSRRTGTVVGSGGTLLIACSNLMRSILADGLCRYVTYHDCVCIAFVMFFFFEVYCKVGLLTNVSILISFVRLYLQGRGQRFARLPNGPPKFTARGSL